MKTSLKSFFLASFVATFGLSSMSAENSQMKAVVTKAIGKTEVQDSTTPGKWISISEGATLKKGDIIQTGFKSELEIQIKGSTVKVSPLTRITLEQLVEKENKDETRIYIDTGSIKSNVKKSEDRAVGFKVRSPVATASVRGTVLEVTNKFRSTDIKTHEGAVAVWKSKSNGGAQIATQSEDETPAVMPGEGNSAQDISDGAPKNAFTVTKGQQAGFTSSGTVATPQSNAVKAAASFVAAATQSASTAESETSASFSPTTTAQTTISESAKSGKGAITVGVEW